jgi:hypothetical protein
MSTNFSGPVYSARGFVGQGVPLMTGLPLHAGTYRWVDNTHAHASDNHDGTDRQRPMSTIDAAINRCTANADDVIIVAPGHAETVSGATTIVPDVAGVNIYGLGRGAKRPTLTFSATTSKIIISGANTLFKNFLITTTGTVDVVLGVHVTGAGVVVEDVEIRESAATSQFVLPLHVAAADCKVLGYIFRGAAGDATVTGLRMSGADRLEVAGCVIKGAFQGSADATGAIQSLTTANLNIRIHRNVCENTDGTSEAGIVFVATDTGYVYENFIAVPSSDFGQGIVVDDLMRQYNNYVVDVAQERGAPEGTASA